MGLVDDNGNYRIAWDVGGDQQPGVGGTGGGGTITPNAFNQIITDSSSFSFTIDSGSRNAIQWIAAKDRILIGTTGGEWRLSGHSNKPLTPSNKDIKIQTVWGSKDMQPLVLHEAVLFVDSVGKKLREMVWDGIRERYLSPDLLLLAEHITKSGGITTMAYQRHPDSIIWATLANGDLISCTYVREQDVIAWARHLLPLGGEAGTVVPSEGYYINPEYPILQELTAAEIPDAPTEPSDKPLTGATEITDDIGLEAITGSGNYKIMNDIDLDGVTWTPITGFTGVLDGQGYTIRNLTVDNFTSNNQGMFGTIGVGGEIRNINISNFTITGKDYVGCLVGRQVNTGTLTLKNIHILNSTLVGENYVASLIGAAFDITVGNIFDCDATSVSITCDNSSGGLFGDIDLDSNATDNLNIINCHVFGGTLISNEDFIGGFGGIVFGRTISDGYKAYLHTCTSSMAISSPAQTEGAGIAGFLGTTGSVVDIVSCSSTGDITITDSSSGTFQGIASFLGFDGGFTNCINSFTTGNLTIDGTNLSNLNFIGVFVGKWDAGHSGSNDQQIYRRCYATGNLNITVSGDDTWDAIGGFGGSLQYTGTNQGNILVERCWATGDITVNEGDVPPSDSKGSTGAFLGEVRHGGSGAGQTVTIRNCYAWGSIAVSNLSASDAAYTGFLGTAYSTSSGTGTITLTNCYDAQTDIAAGSGFTDQIPDVTYANGVVGYVIRQTITATALFWDTVTSGRDEDDYAVGHITSWMQTQDNYEDAGWDFDTIWSMPTPSLWRDSTNSNALGANSVTVIPGATEDEIWISVGRAINGNLVRYIERMKVRYWGTDQEDVFFVDSGLTYDGNPTTTFSGLDHLEGEEVAILGDGAVFPIQTVVDGSITLNESVSVVHIGLPYTYKLKPMRADQNISGTTKGSIKVAAEAVVSFYKTLNARYSDGTDSHGIDFGPRETYTSPMPLHTGDKVVHPDAGYNVEDPFQIEGSDPLPCTVRCIIPRIEKTGR